MDKQALKLFVLGYTPVARRAIKNLEILCSKPEISTLYSFSVVNLYDFPECAEQEKILATPLLIINNIFPMVRIIGDLSNSEQIFELLTNSSGNYE